MTLARAPTTRTQLRARPVRRARGSGGHAGHAGLITELSLLTSATIRRRLPPTQTCANTCDIHKIVTDILIRLDRFFAVHKRSSAETTSSPH
ncbi:hypothetical protein EVAR_24149_1 [Eumeta japonica]|uniref:Uncharacterized protein n=1 Tax=Eumeta variegata TaxID=151549 RepID=A0A4C1YR81_EUMVA|nr:hypothetical protein EVAR_24149_1 [Eumeta japonica]